MKSASSSPAEGSRDVDVGVGVGVRVGMFVGVTVGVDVGVGVWVGVGVVLTTIVGVGATGVPFALVRNNNDVAKERNEERISMNVRNCTRSVYFSTFTLYQHLIHSAYFILSEFCTFVSV